LADRPGVAVNEAQEAANEEPMLCNGRLLDASVLAQEVDVASE